MRIRFEHKKLVDALNKINKVASAYKTSKEYGNLKMSSGDNLAIFEIGNSRGFLHLEIEGEILEGGTTYLNASNFIGVATKLSNKIIDICSNDNEVVITDSVSKVKLEAINSNLFIAKEGLTDGKSLGQLTLNGKELNKAVDVCLPFEDAPQYIPGINLSLQDDGRLRLCCCSNASAGMYFMQPLEVTQDSNPNATLPTQDFKDICDIINQDDARIEFFEPLIRITLPNGFVTLRTFNKAYPKIEKIIPSVFECELPVRVAEFNNALNLIDVIASDGSAFIKYQTDKCAISSKAGFSTNIPIKLDSEVILKIDRGLFKRVFRLLHQPELTLLYSGYKKPLVVKEGNIIFILSVLEQK